MPARPLRGQARSTVPAPAARATPGKRLARKGAPPRHGFVSKAQWRFAFATDQPWAHSVAHKTPGGKKLRYDRLPTRKTAPSARTAR